MESITQWQAYLVEPPKSFKKFTVALFPEVDELAISNWIPSLATTFTTVAFQGIYSEMQEEGWVRPAVVPVHLNSSSFTREPSSSLASSGNHLRSLSNSKKTREKRSWRDMTKGIRRRQKILPKWQGGYTVGENLRKLEHTQLVKLILCRSVSKD